MKTRVTIELNTAEDTVEKTILVTWREHNAFHKPNWFYKCDGYDGNSWEHSLSGFAPISEDIKEILKQILCEAVDKMEGKE